MRFFFSIPVLFVLLLQTTTQCSTQTDATISGKVKLTEAWKPMLYLVQPRNFAETASSFSGTVLDSARVAADGSFAFNRVPISQAQTLFQLCIQKAGTRFPNQLLDDNPLLANYMPVVLSAHQVLEISAEAQRFQASFFIQNPSAENHALLQLRDLRLRLFQQEQPFLSVEKHADENTLLDYEAALLRFREPLMRFADSSTHFWPAILAARWVSPSFDYERVPEFMFRQCEKWGKSAPENPWTAQLCAAGNREKLPVLLGDKIPDFLLPLAKGDTLTLHNLLGARITILDIWASWCAPCRRENRDVLAPIWAKYKDQGLQIIGYSIDSSPDAWKAAIAKDGTRWPHASHLSGDETPFLSALRINTIPANFILDAEGKVIAKNLHGDSIISFLEDYLEH